MTFLGEKMKILLAKYILTCDENFTILHDKAIVFDDKIIEICDFKNAVKKYGNEAEILDYRNDFLMPAFINPHIHLEFSANRTTLEYGDFLKWLKSVINSRDELSKEAKNAAIKKQIEILKKSGVGTIGEISSFGIDTEICANSGIRTIFFNEILGSNPKFINQSWEKFLTRFEYSKNFTNDMFIPAISVHSPYSTAEILTKKACDFARKNNLLMSTHFLESGYEREWLDGGNDDFKKYLLQFSENPKPFYTLKSFIEHFKELRTLFTHCVFVDDFSVFDVKFHAITHCAVSNRFLSAKTLDLNKIRASNINYNIATDGLSSNISLNFLDELRANLFIHDNENLCDFARELLQNSTSETAKFLGLDLGEISIGKIADFSIFNGFEVSDENQIALQIILQNKNVKKLFIKGKLCEF